MPDSAEVLKKRLSDIEALADGTLQDSLSIEEELRELSIDILNISGHDRENIFFDLEFKTPIRVKREFGIGFINFPAIAAKSAASPPHVAIAIEPHTLFADLSAPTELEERIGQYLLSYKITSRAERTVILTPNAIAILGTKYPGKAYPLSNFTRDHAGEVIESLKPPNEYPEGKAGKFPPGYHPNQTKLTRWLFSDSKITPEYQAEIDTQFYRLDIDEYSQMLYNAYSAESNVEKGNLLEDVAEYLFEGLSLVEVRDRNLRTKSDEIDLVLEYVGGPEPNLFQYHSRFIILECKNVGSSISSKEVAHFDTKITRTGGDLGILIAWNGVSGQESGNNAQRYVDTSLESDIVVISSDDLYKILDGKSLYEIIDEKIYALRFDL